MKLEPGSQKVTSGIPQKLQDLARSLTRACHTVTFLKVNDDVFYAVGELGSAAMADIYIRHETKTVYVVGADDKIMVTIKIYGILWLPMLNKPQIVVYHSTLKGDIYEEVAKCWATILGAASMFPLIDSQGGFNRKMAGMIVEDAKSFLPDKIYNKMAEYYSMDELPGMPQTNRTDVLARFVALSTGYILPRVASAHISFYFGLFKAFDTKVNVESEKEFRFDSEEDFIRFARERPPVSVHQESVNMANYISHKKEYQNNEEIPLEEKGETAPLDETTLVAESGDSGPEPVGRFIDSQPAEKRLAFDYPNRDRILGNLVAKWREVNHELTEEDLYQLGVKYQKDCELYEAKKVDAPKILAPTTGRQDLPERTNPISDGKSPMSMRRLGLPKRK